MSRPKRALLIAAAVLLAVGALPFVCLGGAWLYTMAQLEAAKRQGIYDTPEDGMRTLLKQGWPDAERIEIERAGTNSFDGSHPHVWYVIGRAWLPAKDGREFRPQGYGGGSFFLRVDEGWVHIPEGFFPDVIGVLMEWFGMVPEDVELSFAPPTFVREAPHARLTALVWKAIAVLAIVMTSTMGAYAWRLWAR